MNYLGEYNGVGWENEPSQKTPINAKNLGIMEDAIKRIFNYLIAGGAPVVPDNPENPDSSGKDGREIELRNNGTFIQWRYVDDENWSDLVSLEELKGDEGAGIKSIKYIGSNGLVDTYAITLTNGMETTFLVTNGKNGTDANVTDENIKAALGYTPADAEKVNELTGQISDLQQGGTGGGTGINEAEVNALIEKYITDNNITGVTNEEVEAYVRQYINENVSDDTISVTVQEWLDAHPEATTTVQDGSIDEVKLTSSLRSSVKNGSMLEIMSKIVSGEIRVIHLYGDSITDGYGGSNYNGTKSDGINNTEGYCWANQLKKVLESRYGCTVVNQGSYGSTISNQLYKLKNNLTDDVDLVIWLTGTNNRVDESKFAEYKNNIGSFIDYVQERCELVVVSCIPSTKDNEESFVYTTRDIDDVVMKSCYEHNAKYVSGYKEFQKWLYLKGYPITSCFYDHVHPNDFGYYIIFLMICDALKIPLSPYEVYSYTDGENGDDSGGESGGTTTNYSVSNMLTNCATSNSAKSVSAGSSYTATITPTEGYGIESAVITMGGSDVTNEVYSNGKINIPAVTGDIVITIIAEKGSSDVITEIDTTERTVNKMDNVAFSQFAPMVYMPFVNDVEKTTALTNRTVDKITLYFGTVGTVSIGTINIKEWAEAGGNSKELGENYTTYTVDATGWQEIDLTDLAIGDNETLAIGKYTDTTKISIGSVNGVNGRDEVMVYHRLAMRGNYNTESNYAFFGKLSII